MLGGIFSLFDDNATYTAPSDADELEYIASYFSRV